MKLGEMLVRDGRIDAADLDRIIAHQAQEGGRLGSLMVAAELIDAETLTVYLGLELGIPIATGATFERCKRSAVRLLTPEQAARFRCIPIVIQGQTLILAVDDPHDMQLLDEVSQATGYRVIPRVAPEIRIYYYLERFYGIPQPPHFAAMPAQRGSTETTDGLPAPPLPGLPPRVAQPTEAPMPAPPLRARKPSRPPPPVPSEASAALPTPIEDTDEHEALELDAADLVEELEADEELVADTAPRTERPQASDEASEEVADTHDPLSLEEALQIIAETQKRGDIADAILGHAAELFEIATLLLVRDNMAFGWKGFGPGLDNDRIETLLMPLEEAPSMFKVALSADDHLYRARAFHSTLHSHWFRVLRTSVPNYSIVVVCSIGKRIVNLVYGQREDGADLSDEQMEGLQSLMKASSDAYVRLISKSKKERRAATMNPNLGMATAAETPEKA